MTEASVVQTEASFVVDVKNISALNSFWTPQCTIQEIPLSFNIAKNMIDNEEWLGIYLHCKKVDKPHDWSVVAASTIKLIPFRGHENTIEKNIFPCVFDYNRRIENRGFGTSQFIKWSELFNAEKNYVENDTIIFKIKVHVANPNDKNASKLQIDSNQRCDNCNQISLRLTVINIDNIMAVKTPEFVLNNSNLDLTIYKDPLTGVWLRLWKKNSATSKATQQTTIDFKMKSSIKDVADIEKTTTRPLATASVSLACLSWEELFKPENGFVVNNSISFEVKIKIDEPKEAASSSKKRRATSSAETEARLPALECAVCLNKIKDQPLSSTDCGHIFCENCITNAVRVHKRCPTCNTDLNLKKVRRVFLPIVNKD